MEGLYSNTNDKIKNHTNNNHYYYYFILFLQLFPKYMDIIYKITLNLNLVFSTLVTLERPHQYVLLPLLLFHFHYKKYFIKKTFTS